MNETNISDLLLKQSYNVNFDLTGTGYSASEVIGCGAYGVVCCAVNDQTSDRVAIKKVQNVFANPVLALRTYREIKILKHFCHDNVIRIRDILIPPDQNFTDVYVIFDLMESDLHR